MDSIPPVAPNDRAFRLSSRMPLPDPVSTTAPDSVANALRARKALFWDRIARKYAADPIADMAGYETTLQRVRSLLSGDQDVLEIGCGTGSTALRLAPFAGSMLATDVSAEMIAIARERWERQPTPQLRFAVADADAPVFAQGAYDAVLAFNMLHLVQDLDAALALAAQTLRPGGLLIAKTPCVAEMNPLIPYVALPLLRAIRKVPHMLCFRAEALQSAIARQGMRIVSVERHGTRGKDIRVFIVARKQA